MEPPVSSRKPEASIVGFRRATPAISVRRSTIGATEPAGRLKALGGHNAPPNRREEESQSEILHSFQIPETSCDKSAVHREARTPVDGRRSGKRTTNTHESTNGLRPGGCGHLGCRRKRAARNCGPVGAQPANQFGRRLIRLAPAFRRLPFGWKWTWEFREVAQLLR